jgi:hypothetical protein
MHCNNENMFGNFFYLPYCGVHADSEVHECVMFNDIGAIYSVCVLLLLSVPMRLNIDVPVRYVSGTRHCD